MSTEEKLARLSGYERRAFQADRIAFMEAHAEKKDRECEATFDVIGMYIRGSALDFRQIKKYARS